MKRLLLAGLLALATSSAFGQSVQQSGSVTRNHLPYWIQSGVIGDAGTSADSPISSIGVTNNGGAGICVNSARISSGAWNSLCLSASTAAAAVISLQNNGTAAAQSLIFNINGSQVTLPTGGGGTFPTLTTPVTINDAICAQTTNGILKDCGVAIGAGTQWGLPYYSATGVISSTAAGTNGQFLLGQTGSVPTWNSLTGDVASVSAAGLLTLQKVNGIPFPFSFTAHGVLLGEGTSQFTSSTTSNVGYCLISQGTSSDPIWATCASGSGSAGGSNTQVQINNSGSLSGSTNLTWVSPALSIGAAGQSTGQLAMTGATSGAVTIQSQAAAGTYNFNLPTTAGSNGQPLLSGGGASTAMSFGTLGIGGGGTNATTASGTSLDNITGFASNGYIKRTGAGTYTQVSPIPVSDGGTNLASGTSGGILGYTAAGTLASSAALAANGVMIGGGAGATPTAIAACTNGQLVVGATSAPPACQTMGGDITTITSGGVITIANSAITVAKMANAAAYSLLGNYTGSSAAPTYSTIGALSQKVSPSATDQIMISDQAAAGALKYATVSSIASAGSVSSIAGNTGSFTLAAGVTNSTNQIQLDGNYTGYAASNCTLAASVGSNLLTVALKDNTGADPSATSPCYINYRSSTASTGTTTLVPQTAALSISTNATGATLGSSNNTAFRFWVVSFNNGGTNVLALINCATATAIFPLNEGAVASSTAISGSATSAGVFYTPNGTTVTSKAFRILGYVEYNSTGLATAGTYASGPNFIHNLTAGTRLPMQEVQIQTATSAVDENTTSASFVASAALTLSLTPTSAANRVRCTYGAATEVSLNGVYVYTQIYNATAASSMFITNSGAHANTTTTDYAHAGTGFNWPNSTAAQNYVVRYRSDSGGTRVDITPNAASDLSSLICSELQG